MPGQVTPTDAERACPFQLAAAPALTDEWDNSHVWERYLERQLGEDMCPREIFVHPGGPASIYRHHAQCELSFMAGGNMHIGLGADPDHLHEYRLELGQRFFEVVYRFSSHTDIKRAYPMVASIRPEFLPDTNGAVA